MSGLSNSRPTGGEWAKCRTLESPGLQEEKRSSLIYHLSLEIKRREERAGQWTRGKWYKRKEEFPVSEKKMRPRRSRSRGTKLRSTRVGKKGGDPASPSGKRGWIVG